MKKAYLIVLIFGLLLIGFLAGFFISNGRLTGNVIQNTKEYAYTSAICNAERGCIDVLISCKDGAVVRMEPVSDLKIFNESWSDPRGNQTAGFCK